MQNDLQAYADSVVKHYDIPAVSLALWQDGALSVGAAGVLNVDTGVEATSDSLFQIGSITKVFTTCLVMQLVDEGKIDLDKPVRHYLRDFLIADVEAANAITVRQLLNHTNGIEGDYFPDDTHHQGNLIARYVDRCSLLPLVHPVGEQFCYSNAAFVVAGRLIEVVRGISWYQAIQEFIFEPLEMHHAIADPKEMMRFRVAMGHVQKENAWVLPDSTYWTLGQAPAGTTIAMTAANLIAFARANLPNSLIRSDGAWLSPASIQHMQTPSKSLPQRSKVKTEHIGLGWMMTDYHSKQLQVIDHGGATMGFLSRLFLIPEKNIAFAILLNSFSVDALGGLSRDFLTNLAEVETKEPDQFSQTDIADLSYLQGRYDALDSTIEVYRDQHQLKASVVYKLDPLPEENWVLRHIEGDYFATFLEGGGRSANICFIRDAATGAPQYLLNGFRLNRYGSA